MTILFALLLGMFAGWCFIPKPKLADDLLAWLIVKMPFLAPFARKG